MASLDLGPFSFGTKAEAGGWLKGLKDLELLTAWHPGSEIFLGLCAALARHPNRAFYPEEDPLRFLVGECPTYKQNRLTAHWTMSLGQPTPVLWMFSYRRCVSPVPRKAQVRQAFKNEVFDQLLKARTPGRHQIFHEGELDFGLMIEVFLELNFIKPASFKPKDNVYLCTDAGQSLHFLVDRSLGDKWKEYHRENAKLRAMTGSEYIAEIARDREDILLGVNP